MTQLTLFEVNNENIKVGNSNNNSTNPTYIKPDKIKQNIKKWNTIKHIYRYQTFYKICSILYFLTFDNQLACLDYYSETEKDGKEVYTIKYAIVEETMALSIKERIKEHIKILKQIKSGAELEHDIKKIDSDSNTLF